MADCCMKHEEAAVMADFVKVAVARDMQNDETDVTKIWRFRRSYVTEYTLAEVEADLIKYFPDIASKNLGISLKYYDSLVKKKLKIESDGDLRVNCLVAILTERH